MKNKNNMKKKSKKRGRENFWRKNFIESWNYIKSSKRYIYFSICVFILFFLIGLVLQTPAEIQEAIKQLLQELLDKTKDFGVFEMIMFIFKNNLTVSIVGLVFGAIFCIVPFFFAVSNGYVLGYVVKTVFEKVAGISALTSLWRLFPHGIFELPAIFISLGLGLRLGVSLIKFLNKNSFGIFWKDFKDSMRVLFFIIIPLLIIAAIIEGILIIFLK